MCLADITWECFAARTDHYVDVFVCDKKRCTRYDVMMLESLMPTPFC